jgi:hypothetical protein
MQKHFVRITSQHKGDHSPMKYSHEKQKNEYLKEEQEVRRKKQDALHFIDLLVQHISTTYWILLQNSFYI